LKINLKTKLLFIYFNSDRFFYQSLALATFLSPISILLPSMSAFDQINNPIGYPKYDTSKQLN